jgi:hypothetical protein
MTVALRILRQPILLLLALALVAGLFVFRDYGLSWDEPLFYDYGDALEYAYTPGNWVGGTFDLSKSYGPSADDHKTRGPAYLLVGTLPVQALRQLGLDRASSWHLVNFVTFLLGVYFVYGLCRSFVEDRAAVLAAALFASQPLLWGHAFINPKDMPFLVMMAGSVWLGFRMVDTLTDGRARPLWAEAGQVVLPALSLGLASANRVLGPFGGLLVAVNFIARRPTRRTILWLGVLFCMALLVMIAAWPYLWESPLRFFEAFGLMAQNPTTLPVLFADSVYRAHELPRRYLPFFLGATLTEPVWPLFAVGIAAVGSTLRLRGQKLLRAVLLLAWLVIPLGYVLLVRPPMYDGMRHFLFVVPPVFVIGSIGLQTLFRWLRGRWIRIALGLGVLAPGLAAMVALHPYEYAYYNAFAGGTGGVYRHYETDFWLTCYKEAVEDLNATVRSPVRLYVHREAAVAAPYAAANVQVAERRGSGAQIKPGDLVLVNTRTNEDLRTFRVFHDVAPRPPACLPTRTGDRPRSGGTLAALSGR